MKKAVKNIWKIICYPMLYLGMQVAVSFVYAIALGLFIAIKLGIESAISGGSAQADNAGQLVYSQINLMIPVVVSAFGTLLIIFFILRKEWKTEKFWSFAGVKISPALLCLSLGIAANILTICILSMLSVSQQPSPLDDLFGNSLIVDLLVVAVLAPVLEEIIFRGIVLKRLSKITRRNTAVFLQALIFGIIHLNLLQGVYAFFLAIFIGYIYIWFDSVWYAVLIHVAYNATNILLLYIFGDSEVNLFYFLVISGLVFIVSMASLVALADRRKEKAYPDNYPGNNNNRWQL